MELPFHTLDVFTNRVFGGNPLGVFPDAGGLSDALMQRIAREMNLSETVFLSPPESPEATCRVRIFTPAVEVPFAGHPSVGTGFFLAATGAVELPEQGGAVVLEENIGHVRVDVEVEKGHPVRSRLTAAVTPEHRPCEWTQRELARMLSLPDGAVGDGTLEPEMVSLGLPYIIVPVRDLQAARQARLDMAIWEELTAGAWSRMLYVVTSETERDDSDVHARMFAPAAGVPEDPATGSAAVALAAYLAVREGTGDGTLGWVLEQGMEMGRPSRLETEAEMEGGKTTAVRVGGASVLVSRGIMRVPDAEADR